MYPVITLFNFGGLHYLFKYVSSDDTQLLAKIFLNIFAAGKFISELEHA